MKKKSVEKKNKIQVFQTTEELAEAACKFIIRIATKAVDTRGRFTISLSGGNTPAQLYALLSKPPFSNQIPWNKTFVFWGDERCVQSNDEQNNAHMTKTLLLDHVAIPPSNINPIPVDLQPTEAASEYENTLKKFFGNEPPCFDCILLGLGENGHTASLFPGSDVIFEHKRLVKEVYVTEQKMFRVTMTADLINRAHHIMFLVEGESKAEILNTVLTDSYQPAQFPAQLINPVHGNLNWFVDNKAAALLPDNFISI